MLSDSELLKKAGEGDASILQDPRVSTIKDMHGATPLHLLALAGAQEVLDHPDVARVTGINGETPIHVYALRAGKKAQRIVDFPGVADLKDDVGNTPLHYLAFRANRLLLEHPLSDVVKNKKGETPEYMLAVVQAYVSELISKQLQNKQQPAGA